jgi:hypothetical protein
VHSDPEVESFSLSLVLPDGRVLVQSTWPTITVQLLRRQVATTLQLSHDTVFFVCHGVVLDLERRLSDEPSILADTPVYVFFTLAQAMQALGGRQLPPTSPPPASSPAPMGPELLPGFVRAPRNSSAQPPPRNVGSTQRGSANDKLRASFKLPRFNGDARQWKQWNKSFVRFMAIQLLDHVLEETFKQNVLTDDLHEDNKLVYYLLEDAVTGSPVATKYVRRAPEWDGHAAYTFLYDGYSFSGPATATLLLGELSNFRFKTDESVSELVLRLQEMFEDLEAVPGTSAVTFGDTQKINYLLSAIKHERALQPVYVQIQTDQLRGRISFDQACDDLRYRCETNRADELLNAQLRPTNKVRGLLVSGDTTDSGDVSSAVPAPSLALITTNNKRQNKAEKAETQKTKTPCHAKGCSSTVPSHLKLCRLHYHECIAGKHPSLPLRTGGVARYDAATNKIVYPSPASGSSAAGSSSKSTVRANVAFAVPAAEDN